MNKLIKNYNCVIVTTILSVMIIATFITLIYNIQDFEPGMDSIIAAHFSVPELRILEILMFLLMGTIFYSSRKNQNEKNYFRNYGSLLEESSSNIIGINAMGIIYYANRPALKTLGINAASDIQGESINSLVFPVANSHSPSYSGDLFSSLREQKQLSGDAELHLENGGIIEINYRACEIDNGLEKNKTYAFTFVDNRGKKVIERSRIRENHLQSQTIELSNAFLKDENFDAIAQKMLNTFISVTDSEYGFVAEVLTDAATGEEYLQVGALTNIAWNQATKDLYKPSGMIFRGLNTLWGKVLTTCDAVISNNPLTDPRSKGLPKGHPPMNCFMGIPFMAAGKVVGMVGLANNPEGYSEKDINFLAPMINVCAQIIVAKRNKNEIRFLNNRYRELLDEAPIMYLFVGTLENNRQILECNMKFADLIGYEMDQLIGRNLLDILPLSSREEIINFHTEQSELAFKPMSTRLELLDKSGRSITTQVTVIAEYDENGKCEQFKYMLIDMSNCIDMQEENQQLSIEFQRLIDSIGSVVIVTNEKGEITHWNRKISSLTGKDIFDVAGQQINALDLNISNKASLGEILNKALNGQEYQGFSLDLTDTNGEVQNLYLNFTCRNSVKGEFLGLIIMGQILTNYLTTMTEHYSMQKIEAIGQLTGGVAHDFNNLLTIILGNLEYLEEAIEDKSNEISLAIMDATSAARDGVGLTKNLLAFARRRPLHQENFNLNDVLNNVSRLGARTLGEKIRMVLSLNTNLTLDLDRSMLESSILNLIINARDAMNGEGTISIDSNTVSYSPRNQKANIHHLPDGHYCVIRITDTGTGMTDEIKQHAIEPFFTTKSDGNGTGLGLSMVYGFIKQCSGDLKIDSQIGRGTTISIYLPVSREKMLSPSQDSNVESGSGNTSKDSAKRILVVEDEDRVRNNAVRMLTGAGFSVFAVENAERALEAVENQTLDLVFSDIVMPGKLDGKELASLVSTLHPELKVQLTSGYDKNFDPSVDSGHDILPKPYNKAQLLEAIAAKLADNYNLLPKDTSVN